MLQFLCDHPMQSVCAFLHSPIWACTGNEADCFGGDRHVPFAGRASRRFHVSSPQAQPWVQTADPAVFPPLGDFFSPFADGFRRASTGVKAAILGGTAGAVAIVVCCLVFFGGKDSQPAIVSRAMAMPDAGSADGLVTIELTPSPSRRPPLPPPPSPFCTGGWKATRCLPYNNG